MYTLYHMEQQPTKTKTEEKIRPLTEVKDQEARFFIEQAGKTYTNPGYEYMGSIAVHAFVSKFGNSVEFVTQSLVGTLPEQAGIEMSKACVEAVMRAYGREPPRKRK